MVDLHRQREASPLPIRIAFPISRERLGRLLQSIIPAALLSSSVTEQQREGFVDNVLKSRPQNGRGKAGNFLAMVG
jgi:hypothetical protein